MKLFLIFSFVLSAPCFAMTVGDSVKKFIQHSEEIQAAKAEKKEVDLRYKEAKSAFFPSIDLSVGQANSKSIFYLGSQTVNSDNTVYSTSLDVSQPIYLGGQIWAAYRFKKILAENSGFDLKDKSNKAIAGFLTVITSWMSLKEQMEELQSTIDLQKKLVSITRKKKSRGAVSLYEWDQVQADLFSYEHRMEVLAQNFKNIDRQVRSLLNIGANKELKVSWGEFKMPIVGGKGSGWVEKAKNQRADWQMAKAQVDLVEAQNDIDIGSEKPSISLYGSYGYQNKDFSKLTEDGSDVSSYGITLKVPLFSGLSSVHKRKAGAELKFAAEKKKELMEKSISVEVANKLEGYQSSYRQYVAAQSWTQKSAEALKQSIRAFRLGKLSISQMSLLQTAKERASASFADAKRQYVLAKRDWYLAIGEALESKY